MESPFPSRRTWSPPYFSIRSRRYGLLFNRRQSCRAASGGSPGEGVSSGNLRPDLAVNRKKRSVPAFEMILQRPNVPDKILYRSGTDAQIGDVVLIDGRPWVIIEKEPPFELRRIERIVCVPRKVHTFH